MRRLLISAFSIALLVSLTACGDKSTGPETPQGDKLTESMAVTAVKEVFKERGLYSNSSGQSKTGQMSDEESNVLGFGKYYDVDLDLEGGRIDVTFDVGSEGNIIPDGEWRDNNPDFCREKNRFMQGAKKQLNYKVFPFNDGWDVFVQYIDVPTNEVENQREGQSPDPNLEGLEDAINNAMDNFEPDVKPATNGCGEKFPLKLVLTSNTKIEGIYDPQRGTTMGIVAEDEVELEVPLTYNNQQQAYEGSGQLRWLAYELSTDGPQQIDCPLPDSDPTGIPKFYDGTVDSLKQGNKVMYVRSEGSGWGLPLPVCTITLEDGTTYDAQGFTPIPFPFVWNVLQPPAIAQIEKSDQSMFAYEIKQWQDVPGNDEVIARRVYDRTETGDTLGFKTYTEKTTMEIRRSQQ
ncbi:MAG: hypothetical protein GWN00_28190 [Aliifodinibius sp.]|nr:hypothetical protein [Fodinibius sp.]NIV14648.1 hypothetical protein [Fodinibius sp.]NIY28542.1 hypothetical protein [Fodinibius sp.]